MSAEANTWMPFYVSDYLADTMHLTTEQHGAYLMMLMAAWKRGGYLPNEDSQLAAICKLSVRTWKKSKDVLLEFFTLTDKGYAHKRVVEELGKAKELSEKRREASRQRWSKSESTGKAKDEQFGCKDDANGYAHGNANTDAKPVHLQAPSPSPSPVDLHTTLPTAGVRESVEGKQNGCIQDSSSDAKPDAPAHQSPLSGIEDNPHRRGELSALLRNHGVSITPMHPVLCQWVNAGITNEEALDAVERVRFRDQYRNGNEISAGYLAKVVSEVLSERGRRKEKAPAATNQKPGLSKQTRGDYGPTRRELKERGGEILAELAGLPTANSANLLSVPGSVRGRQTPHAGGPESDGGYLDGVAVRLE
jgi:uncharacterized protein YdaU (DUF1376 family)